MKQLIISTMLLILATTTFCQQTKSSQPLTSEDYLKKSKKQKTSAWILLSGGGTLILTGIIIPKGEVIHENFLQKIYKNDGIKSTLISSGAVAMLGSIPFFIASAKNKRKANVATTFFKMEAIPVIQQTGFGYRSYPAISIKISL